MISKNLKEKMDPSVSLVCVDVYIHTKFITLFSFFSENCGNNC